MFGTGAGITVLIAAGLGLLVGVVVVAQTIYAATVDHIREYGTLKAMGASNGYLYRVILQQAAMSAVAGYGVGIGVAMVAARASLAGTTAIILEPPLAGALFVLTLLMCLGASVVSINRVTRIDPAMVFKGSHARRVTPAGDHGAPGQQDLRRGPTAVAALHGSISTCTAARSS